MHHKNNNIAIAEALKSIASSLSKLNAQDSNGSIEIIENELAHLDTVSQEKDAPELRALAHWTMLNIEQEPKSNHLISTLLENGSYHHWMETLSTLLLKYDQSLLPKIYNELTEPTWLVKPSAPLLRNLAGWIEASKDSATNDLSALTTEKHDQSSKDSTEASSEEIDILPPHVFEEVELSVLEKNYCGANNISKEFDEKEDTSIKEAEKNSNYYSDINESEEEAIALNTSSLDISEKIETTVDDEDFLLNEINNEVLSDLVEADDPLLESFNEEVELIEDVSLDLIDEKSSPIAIKELTETSETLDLSEEDENDFSDEVEDIIMTLVSTSAMADNVFDSSNKYIEELERLTMLSEISGYSKISPISLWCQKNISLFSENKSDESRSFIESGECWSWIELINIALNEPDEISHISQLSTELSRSEWIAPINVNDLQELLLFIRNPDMSTDSITENDTQSEVITESHTNFSDNFTAKTESEAEHSFTWDEDTHPELLEAYFEETSGLIKQASQYLKDLGSSETTKEERQNATRTAHTIKGGSAVVGITALSEFAYKLEQILDHSVEHELPKQANTVLNDTAKSLEELYAAVSSKKPAPESFVATFSNISELAESLDDDDDTIIELDAPILPDFITQQNTNKTEETTTTNIEEPESEVNVANETIQEDLVEDSLEDLMEGLIEDPIENLEPENSITDIDEEITDFSAELDDIVMTLMTTEINEKSGDSSIFANHLAELQRLDVLSEISDYPEVSKVSNWCQHNIKAITKSGDDKSREFITSGECWSWIELISACLTDPDEASHLSSLSAELMREEWPETIETKDLQNLLLLLKISDDDDVLVDTVEENTVKEDTTTSTTQENIVTWDEGVHPELLSVYLQETTDQVSKVAVLLHKISKGEADKDEHKLAARIAHTIKGASGVVGVSEIVDLTHRLEDILDYSVENELPAEAAELLSESSDCLESLFEAVENKTAVPEEFEQVITKLTKYSSSIESEEYTNVYDDFVALDDPELPDVINSEVLNDAAKEVADSSIDNEILNITQKAIDASNISTEEKVSEKKSIDYSEAHIRVPLNLINRLFNLAGELVTTSTQVADKVENTLEVSAEIKAHDQRVHKMLKELSSTIYKQEKDQKTLLSSMQNEEFDSLEMDTYNELHSVASLLTESILDSETIESTLNEQLHEINNDLRRFDQLNKELSDTILNSRMESLNTLIPRLERIVRQTCRKTNKKAELIVTGNNINIDTEILNGLADPLLHMLRNAIDHGIESPKDRKTKNKDQTGKIHLDFSRHGNFIHMQLTDDGAGINPEKIYKHAIEKGLITPDQEYSKSEVLKLILQPGFSTHENVTDISGRGVGMDVVNDGVMQLKGTLSINSEVGQSTTIKVIIPLTLVTSSTLLVSTAGNQVAIPTDSIEQIYYLSPEDVLNRKGEQFIRHLGHEIAIKSLAGILGWPLQMVDFSNAQTLLLIKGDTELHAIHIDKIIHSREVVIKSLAHFINSSKGVIGACHLTDGAVAPVIYLPQLLSLEETSKHIIKEHQEIDEHTQKIRQTPQILVVDDSLSNRKALSLIIDKIDYDVITAVDGLDALNIMNEKHIDMVFTDLEMPRMTGLELTQSIRAWNDKKHIPVVMITSRSTNKHRQLAEKAGVDDYLTKPVGTDTLLESMETWLKQEAIA